MNFRYSFPSTSHADRFANQALMELHGASRGSIIRESPRMNRRNPTHAIVTDVGENERDTWDAEARKFGGKPVTGENV